MSHYRERYHRDLKELKNLTKDQNILQHTS